MNSAYARSLARNSADLFCEEYFFQKGSLLIVAGHESLKCVLFGHTTELVDLIRPRCTPSRNEPLIKAVVFLSSYFKGATAPVPPLDLNGFTAAERKVYDTCMSISFGETVSYGALASLSGFSRAARFVGSTMAKNRFPVIIPCHRVIRSDGSTGNYTSGEWMKQYLINHEQQFLHSGQVSTK